MTVVPFNRRAEPALEPAQGTGCNGAVVAVAEAMTWAQAAEAGARFRYAVGHLPSWSATPKQLYKLAERGLLALTIKRDVTPKEYWAERTAKPWTAEAPAPRRIARAVPPKDDDMKRLLKVLQAEARGDQPCSTNAVLAIKAGLTDKDRASYLVKELVKAGSITNEAVEWWPGRRITDLSTGAQTRVEVGRPRHLQAKGRAGAR